MIHAFCHVLLFYMIILIFFILFLLYLVSKQSQASDQFRGENSKMRAVLANCEARNNLSFCCSFVEKFRILEIVFSQEPMPAVNL